MPSKVSGRLYKFQFGKSTYDLTNFQIFCGYCKYVDKYFNVVMIGKLGIWIGHMKSDVNLCYQSIKNYDF